MRKTATLISAVIGLGAALAGCGSSTAPGVVLAPSAGPTAAASASAAASSTTTAATSSSSTPLPAALKTKPTVAVPAGAPPKKLLIKDLIKGTGPAATATSTVTVQYVGVLYKGGKQFDASWAHAGAQPITGPLSGFIPGWQQGIPGMRVGGRRELIIPPSLAYGSAARSGIPANSTLVFVIDLHAVS
jgi:peptidylprolyl isomerase